MAHDTRVVDVIFLSRRRFSVLLSVGSLAFAAGLAYAGEEGSGQTEQEKRAVCFLKILLEQGQKELTSASGDTAKAEDFLNKMIGKNVDVERIAKFVAGRAWSKASTERQEAFVQTFRRVLLRRVAESLMQPQEYEIQIMGAFTRPGIPDTVFVDARTKYNQQNVALQFRLHQTENSFRILDVSTAGVSMILTLRSEYGSFLGSAGGDLSRLTESLGASLR